MTDTRTLTFDITGMTCAACAARIEKVVGRMEGVASVSVNLPLERADVVAVPSLTGDTIAETIDNAGYGAVLRKNDEAERRAQDSEREAARARDERRERLMLAFAALLTAPLLAPMLLMPFGITWMLEPWQELALATPVQVIAGYPFFKGAYKALKGFSANMDVLVALGTGAAFALSLFMLVKHGAHAHGHLYFEAAASVITFVLFGKVLEHRARRGTTQAIHALMALRPDTARRRVAGGEELIPVDQVRADDELIVRPDERFCVDGLVVEGAGEADESLVTGESRPVAKHPGDKVLSGSRNGSGLLVIRAVAVGEDTTLARISRMVEAAQAGKAPVQRLVDRISAVFVPVVILIALFTLMAGLFYGTNSEEAILHAVAVLVIACPCALGLATPAALVAGTGAAARAGILIKDIDALERAATVTRIAFDKTGTLTQGTPQVQGYFSVAGDTSRPLLLAAALQGASDHPLARAVKDKAEALGLTPPLAEQLVSRPGQGLEGRVDGQAIRAGSLAFLRANGIDTAPLAPFIAMAEEEGYSLIAVSEGDQSLGLITLSDALRPEAKDAIFALAARHVSAMMISGDTREAATRIGEAVGLPLNAIHAGVRPEGKAKVLKDEADSGEKIAMVGDGVNDAPALASAHLGIAMGTGADAAMESAGITLMRPNLMLIPAALDISRRTRAKIRQNLFFAFVYNVLFIPLAALGYMSPTLAGAAMAMSSVSVVTNALLLVRWRAGD